ncbi:hypothetical protein FRC06_005645, partial [Ceratobasidium sp. 370]
MRSTCFLAFFLFALLSVLQLTLAEPVPSDDLVERGTNLDIAPSSGSSQHAFDGGLTLGNSKSEKLFCPAGTGFCRNDPLARATGVIVPSAVPGITMAVTSGHASRKAPTAARADLTANP